MHTISIITLLYKYSMILTMQEDVALWGLKFIQIRKDRPSFWVLLGSFVFSISEGECTKKSVDYDHQKIVERRSTVSYTYSVRWKQVNNVNNRWDTFLLSPNPERHLYASINSMIVTIISWSMVGFILFKTRHRRSNSNQNDKDIKV